MDTTTTLVLQNQSIRPCCFTSNSRQRAPARPNVTRDAALRSFFFFSPLFFLTQSDLSPLCNPISTETLQVVVVVLLVYKNQLNFSLAEKKELDIQELYNQKISSSL